MPRFQVRCDSHADLICVVGVQPKVTYMAFCCLVDGLPTHIESETPQGHRYVMPHATLPTMLAFARRNQFHEMENILLGELRIVTCQPAIPYSHFRVARMGRGATLMEVVSEFRQFILHRDVEFQVKLEAHMAFHEQYLQANSQVLLTEMSRLDAWVQLIQRLSDQVDRLTKQYDQQSRTLQSLLQPAPRALSS